MTEKWHKFVATDKRTWPKEEGAYLVTILFLKEERKVKEDVFYRSGRNQFRWFNFPAPGTVLAWQPKPEPYRGE